MMTVDCIPRPFRIYGLVLLWLNLVVFVLSFWAFPTYRAMEGDLPEYVHWIMQAMFAGDALLAVVLLKGWTKPVASALFITSTVYFLCKLIPFFNKGEDGVQGLIIFGFFCYLDFFVWILIVYNISRTKKGDGERVTGSG